MSLKVLVPLDGSSQSERALAYVRMLAAKTEVSVQLLRVFESPASVYSLPELGQEDSVGLADSFLEQKMRDYLEQKKSELGMEDCGLTVACGDPAGHILAATSDVDLVIMSNHGRRADGRWLGGVTTKVVRTSTIPVLVVCDADSMTRKLDRIMVCLDGSSLAEKALEKAVRLAKSTGAKLILYRFVPLVYDGMDMEAQMGMARDYLGSVEQSHQDLVEATLVRWTRGGSDIVACAQELGVDLIAMGSHGSKGVVRLLLGSVAEDAIHRATCPVLIVH